ncbi:MAG: ATP-grasp domain-containing protein [candidate division NC10 bacterium]|nr:ATP-grasp domain-containing protein [candidate division NC10 bacterium]
MSDGGKRILVICPTARDRTHFSRPEIRRAYALEFRGTDEATHEPGFDGLAFLQETIRMVRGRRQSFQAVVGIDDFPACMMAALLAETLGLPSPSFESLFLCQHKYYSRVRQREVIPEATPRFHALDIARDPAPSDLPLPFPVFIKPAKSYLSILARRIETFPDLASAVAEARLRLAPVAHMFNALLGASTLDGNFRAIPGSALLVEELLSGHQVTLDGYACGGQVVPLGVVDSFFFLRSSSFERFEYPSRLPAGVQERMAGLAERVIRHIGLDRTFFDIEFFYREEDDSIWLIEINGRMSSQFAPLYRMVDGIDLYAMQLEMALGRDPGGGEVWGAARNRRLVSASFVMRTFENGIVRRIPSTKDIRQLERRFPEAFVEILVREGEKLSDELQDDESYRYALVDLAAEDRKALLKRYDEAKNFLPFEFTPIR